MPVFKFYCQTGSVDIGAYQFNAFDVTKVVKF